jgi:hypothetical protein
MKVLLRVASHELDNGARQRFPLICGFNEVLCLKAIFLGIKGEKRKSTL